MSLETERVTIEKRWIAGWVVDGGSAPLTPFQLEGIQFEQPTKAPWARLVVRHGTVLQASIGSPGSNIFRHPGVIMIQLFAPSTKGTKQLRTLGETACNIFRATRVGNITFRVPSFALLDSDGPWARAIVNAPFYRDESY